MLNQLMNKMTLSRMGRCIMCVYSSVCQRISCSGFWGWMYPLHGGGETTSEAALGVLILWFCWWAHAHITHTYIHTCMHVCIPMHTHTHPFQKADQYYPHSLSDVADMCSYLHILLCRFAFNCGSTESMQSQFIIVVRFFLFCLDQYSSMLKSVFSLQPLRIQGLRMLLFQPLLLST